MYTPKQIVNGVKNPRRGLKFVYNDGLEHYHWKKFGIINKINHYRQKERKSKYGLVLNKGMYTTDYWGVSFYKYFTDEFIDTFNPIIISSQQTYDEHKDNLDYIFSFEPKYSAPAINYSDLADHTVVTFTSDPNNKVEWFDDYIKINNIDYVVTPYYGPFLYYFPDFNEDKLIHFPWAVPEEAIINPNDIEFKNQKNLSIFGNSGKEYYKDRDWCRKFSFVENYEYYNENRVGSREEYYKWLKNFDVLIAAHSNEPQWRYLVAKFIEIPCGGSLLFAQDVKDIKRAGFNEKNCVIFNVGDFEEKARNYLENPESYMDRRRQGVRLIKSRHTVKDRIEKLKQIFNS